MQRKSYFTACHSGKLKLAFTSPDVISTSLKNYSTGRIDSTVLLLFEFLKRHHLPVRKSLKLNSLARWQNPLTTGFRHYFLCTLSVKFYCKRETSRKWNWNIIRTWEGGVGVKPGSSLVSQHCNLHGMLMSKTPSPTNQSKNIYILLI